LPTHPDLLVIEDGSQSTSIWVGEGSRSGNLVPVGLLREVSFIDVSLTPKAKHMKLHADNKLEHVMLQTIWSLRTTPAKMIQVHSVSRYTSTSRDWLKYP
jgi:hypothetical protein